MSKPKVAVVHNKIGNLEKMGGSESVALWAIEALKSDYDVTLISIVSEDFKEKLPSINVFFGTSLEEGDFSLISIPKSVWRAPAPRAKLWAFRVLRFMNYCRRFVQDFDVVLSTFNETDLKKRCIQYIHFPVLRSYFPANVFLRTIKRIYHNVLGILFDYSVQRMSQNDTLVNSYWTRGVVKELYGISSQVIYPPVMARKEFIDWSEREDGFLCIGRLSPEKKIERVVEIIRGVRARGFDVHLRIMGPEHDKEYASEIKKIAEENSEWIFYEGAVSRDELIRHITSYKYGIHAMEQEHFGIGIAEMVTSGCLVFIPDGGGQREIVNYNERLIYKDTADAIEKTVRVISDRQEQEQISKELMEGADRFSTNNFCNQIRAVVAETLAHETKS